MGDGLEFVARMEYCLVPVHVYIIPPAALTRESVLVKF